MIAGTSSIPPRKDLRPMIMYVSLSRFRRKGSYGIVRALLNCLANQLNRNGGQGAMTMRLRLRDVGVEQVAFGCSPAHEALRSLHVLSNVKHHPLHISWALRTRARMTSELKGEIERFAFWYSDRSVVFCDILPQADVGFWADELTMLREVPIEQFAEELIHGALMRSGLGDRVALETFLRS